MAEPYTIRIFVPDGDPEGLRIVDKMNWTGVGIAFPREKWAEARGRNVFDQPGVYILVGFSRDDADLPMIYVGEGDGIASRIDSHVKSKEFWNWGVAFASTNRSLNKAHVQWLEYALVGRAKDAARCVLDNGNVPQEPALTESEKADTSAFLKEILQILPLLGLQTFERAKSIAVSAKPAPTEGPLEFSEEFDTVIVPAQRDGFERVFIGENCWHAIRIGGGMLPKIRWIAAYQTQPVSAITHIAPVASIEPYGGGGKFRLNFAARAQAIGPIPFGDAPQGAMQGPRYTSRQALLRAKKLTDVVGRSA